MLKKVKGQKNPNRISYVISRTAMNSRRTSLFVTTHTHARNKLLCIYGLFAHMNWHVLRTFFFPSRLPKNKTQRLVIAILFLKPATPIPDASGHIMIAAIGCCWKYGIKMVTDIGTFPPYDSLSSKLKKPMDSKSGLSTHRTN